MRTSIHERLLEPVLLYLDPGPVRRTLRHVAKTRPAEWLDFVIAYHTQQGTGRERGWQGFEGLVRFYKMRRAIELDLLPRLPRPHTRVPHTHWATDQQQVDALMV